MRIDLPESITLDVLPPLMRKILELQQNQSAPVELDFQNVKRLDTSGLGALLRIVENAQEKKQTVQFINIPDELSHLLGFIDLDKLASESGPPPKSRGYFEKVGRNVISLFFDIVNFVEFLGQVILRLIKETIFPHKIRWKDTLYYIESTGINAIPIVALIAFLMGLIIAFQSAGQLKQFGANIFVVDLVAISMTRELGPLMTAIMIAGRSGSAFAAEIGTMKVSEELDAMKVMGLDITEYLVTPKVWAMMVSLPLLAFLADVAGLLGGALIANLNLDIPYYQFMDRLQEKLALRHFFIGIGKCFVFAGIIGIVGCYRGMLVTSGAESVGRQTTASVVMSIFLVILADAGFSVMFTLLGI